MQANNLSSTPSFGNSKIVYKSFSKLSKEAQKEICPKLKDLKDVFQKGSKGANVTITATEDGKLEIFGLKKFFSFAKKKIQTNELTKAHENLKNGEKADHLKLIDLNTPKEEIEKIFKQVVDAAKEHKVNKKEFSFGKKIGSFFSKIGDAFKGKRNKMKTNKTARKEARQAGKDVKNEFFKKAKAEKAGEATKAAEETAKESKSA